MDRQLIVPCFWQKNGQNMSHCSEMVNGSWMLNKGTESVVMDFHHIRKGSQEIGIHILEGIGGKSAQDMIIAVFIKSPICTMTVHLNKKDFNEKHWN